MNLSPYASRKLTDEQVLYVLTSDRTNLQLGDELGVRDSTIQKIRAGMSCTHVHPDVPRPGTGNRRQGPTCEQCVHLFKGHCSLSFPEARKMNYRAATQCSAFAMERVL